MADLSVVIPAHNEEVFLPRCLDGLAVAVEVAQLEVEVIVVLNRCSDRTGEIAREAGARIVCEDARNLARIRNAGAAVASAPVLVTCDADSVPHPHSLRLIMSKLESGRWVGGGTVTLPERWSLGVAASIGAVLPYLVWHGVSFGMFWCRTEDFRAVGGFNEDLVSVEDLDFAKRMRAYGKRDGRRFGTLWRAPLTTSCRKFDQFGDWYLFLNPRFVWRIFRGTDREVADRFWYKVGR